MIEILIITHGKFGGELVKSAGMIIGHQANVTTFQIPPDESQESLKEKLGGVLKQVDKGDGVIIFTDMLGGTPCNICLPYTKIHNIEIVSGVNLYMLITALIYRESTSLPELAKKVLEVGKKNIADVKKMFLGKLCQ